MFIIFHTIFKIYMQCIQCKVSDRKNIIFDDEFPFRRRNGDSRRINRRVGWWEHRENLSIRAVILACVFSSRLPPLQMRSIPLERSFVTMRLHGTPRHTSHSISQTNEQEASYFRTFVKLVASRWSCCRPRGTNSAGTLDFSVRIASRRHSIPPNLTSLILTVLYVFVYRMKIWIYPTESWIFPIYIIYIEYVFI